MFRACERNGVGTKISHTSKKKSSDSLGKLCYRCVFKFCILEFFFACQTRCLEEMRREQNSSRCDDDSPKKKNVFAVHSLVWRHSMQNKFSTWKMNNGECFCENYDILKHSVAMSDACENCETIPGLVLACQDETSKLLCILSLGIFAGCFRCVSLFL